MFEYLPLNIAPWGHELVLYFFIVGTAAMAFVLSSAPSVFGGGARVLEPMQKPGLFLSLILLAICGPLLILDLGQPSRFLYPILHFHWTSPLSWGSVFLVLFGASVLIYLYALMANKEGLLKPVGIIGSLLALSMPLYTGLDLMVQSTRELWADPAIPVLFVALSMSSGTALMALVGTAKGMTPETTRLLRNVLFFSVAVTLALFLAEVVTLTYGSAEQQQAWQFISTEFSTQFWMLTFVVGILIPLALLVLPGTASNPMLVTVAGVLAAVGAYTFREVIIYAGQLPQLYY